MSRNLDQIFNDNPASSMDDTDLLYLARSPYDITNDMGITWSDMKASVDVPTLPISLANGGTQNSLTANAGGIFYSTATTGAISSGTGTANQLLLSGSFTTPSWSTVVFPTSIGVNELLYTVDDNVVSGLTTSASSVLVTDAGGIPAFDNLLPLQVQENIGALGTISLGTWHASIISSTYGGTGVNNGGKSFSMTGNVTFGGITASNFTANLGGNTNVTFPTSGTLATTSQLPAFPITGAQGGTGVNNGASTISVIGNVSFAGIGSHTFTGNLSGDTNVNFPTSGTLATTAQILLPIDQTSVFVSMNAYNAYVTDYPPLLVSYVLPSLASFGARIKIVGKSAPGWIIVQGVGQSIIFDNATTTVGAGGSLSSNISHPNSCVEIMCTTTNTTWTVINYVGTLDVI